MSFFTNKGYNPITKENENITEWIKNITVCKKIYRKMCM